MAKGIKQRAGHCHKEHAIAYPIPTPPHTNPTSPGMAGTCMLIKLHTTELVSAVAMGRLLPKQCHYMYFSLLRLCTLQIFGTFLAAGALLHCGKS
eukprot:353522-Chlamydomonas_euryale.AAC.13